MPDPATILKSYGGKASKRFGQNFLKSEVVVAKIVSAAQPLAGETVLEIGPGLGVLTQALLAEPIAKLVCVEIDPGCVEHLKATIDNSRLRLVQADALQVSEEELFGAGSACGSSSSWRAQRSHPVLSQSNTPAELLDGHAALAMTNLELGHSGKLTSDEAEANLPKFIVIANLPYNISSPLLLKWLSKATFFKRLVLMFQKEVAERICAKPHTKQYGSLSVLAQVFCETKILFDVPSNAFFPQPKVTSSVVLLTPKSEASERLALYPSLKTICSAAFSKRRKTLRNALGGLFDNVEATLASLGLDPNKRPENLTGEEFLQLAAKHIA